MDWKTIALARQMFEARAVWYEVESIGQACGMSVDQVLYFVERDGWCRQSEAGGLAAEKAGAGCAPRGLHDEARVARARALFEDGAACYPISVIADVVGLSRWEVYYRLGRDDWQRRVRRAPRGGGSALTVREADRDMVTPGRRARRRTVTKGE